jgi:hypothetical protein
MPVRASSTHVRLERLREAVRALEAAEQFDEALRAIRESGLVPADPNGFQPEIARLKRAARLEESYRRARAAHEAGDGDAATLLSAVVAIEPRYKDAAARLHEAVSGASVQGLRTEADASREAAARLRERLDRLARTRNRLAWLACAQGVLLLVLGWTSLRRGPAGGGMKVRQAESVAAASVKSSEGASPNVAPPVVVPAVKPATEEPRPAAPSTARPEASAAAVPDPPQPSVEDDPPLDLHGPCHRIGDKCSSSAECCFGSLCFGTSCQDTRRTVVFGSYRP